MRLGTRLSFNSIMTSFMHAKAIGNSNFHLQFLYLHLHSSLSAWPYPEDCRSSRCTAQCLWIHRADFGFCQIFVFAVTCKAWDVLCMIGDYGCVLPDRIESWLWWFIQFMGHGVLITTQQKLAILWTCKAVDGHLQNVHLSSECQKAYFIVLLDL